MINFRPPGVEERFLIFLFRSQLGSVFFLWVCKSDIPQEGVDMMKKQTRRLACYISVKNTDPSRFGCKIWGRRPSVPNPHLFHQHWHFCCLNNHDRIEIYFL